MLSIPNKNSTYQHWMKMEKLGSVQVLYKQVWRGVGGRGYDQKCLYCVCNISISGRPEFGKTCLYNTCTLPYIIRELHWQNYV